MTLTGSGRLQPPMPSAMSMPWWCSQDSHESRGLSSQGDGYNSFEDIDTMVSIKPGVMSEIKPGAMLDDINQEFIQAHEGIENFRDIKPRTYVTVGFYFDWEFDWSNECYIFLRTRRGEEHIKFYFEKYLMAFADQTVN